MISDLEQSLLPGQQVHVEQDELVNASNVRQKLCLTDSGIFEEDKPVLLFDETLGVRREGSRLVYVSYPKTVGIASSCCVSGEVARVRKETVLDCANEEVAKRWEASTWKVLLKDFVKHKNKHIRSFLVLLNPKSGKGHSERVFYNHCQPVFRDAAIECTVIKTEYSGHANEICKTTPDLASKYDGIVIVSGDGLLFEALQGVMSRPDWATVLKEVPFGIIPGGSGNGLAISLAHASGERRGPISNAFLIAKGVSAPMDICAVDHFSRGRIYSFLSLEFGFVADIDIGSEWMRRLGDARFTVEAVRLLFNPYSNKCKFSYLPVEGDPLSPKTAPRVSSYWDTEDCYTGEDGPRTRLSASLNSPVPENWKTVEDNFYFMWHANVAWMSATGHLSPHSRWNDGYTQLCFYRRSKSKSSRVNLLRFLLALETGAHIKDDGTSKYNAIEMFPTQAFRLEPLSRTSTRMAVDGELVEMGPIQIEVLPGLARLMGTNLSSSF